MGVLTTDARLLNQWIWEPYSTGYIWITMCSLKTFGMNWDWCSKIVEPTIPIRRVKSGYCVTPLGRQPYYCTLSGMPGKTRNLDILPIYPYTLKTTQTRHSRMNLSNIIRISYSNRENNNIP